MIILNNIMSWMVKKRIHQMKLFIEYPHDVQNELLLNLIHKSKNTYYGKKYNFEQINSHDDFVKNVPLVKYEDIEHLIEKTRLGEQNIFWSTDIKWFAKSSGTTNSKSKFIPISKESLETCHYKAGKDMLSIVVNNDENCGIFKGKSLKLGGSFEPYKENISYYGDLSSILIENLPFWVNINTVPNTKISLMSNWEDKLEAIVDKAITEDIVSLAGVPSWMMLVLTKVLEKTGKTTISEVWPNLDLFFHGGINFEPYRKQYDKIIGKPINYYQIYNASEGFFGLQDQPNSDEMLLMLDYGIFYEFIALEDIDDKNPKVLTLDQVKLDKNYALVITTNAGLWRYIIGDTIKFTSIKPYRIRVSGRTKHFINAFGEELIIENADIALAEACSKTSSQIKEYSAAPIYMQTDKHGSHQWIIEFEKQPNDINLFCEILDNKLKSLNSDYEAKRYSALEKPQIIVAKKNLFHNWLKNKNKLGGQNKIPRLSNNRCFMEEFIALNNEIN